ncbi:bacteriorhodopsin [Haloarcula halophila]|uniref:bacteriorhodopsin n=1 Tax=Haloarcula TaxID=2237 RepID=UPI0023E40651|nr:bacteriorhodopsin [Halomicroarcula sp. DFY41]
MISETTVYGSAAAVSAIATVAFLVWIRRVPARKRPYCYPVVGVVGLSAVLTALVALDGFYIAGTGQTLPGVIDDFVAYTVLWVAAAAIAGESRRMLALLAVIPMVQVVAFNVAAVVGGLVGLVGLALLVVGQVLIAYLFLGPIWERTDSLPDGQRLLHWKSRNLLLFLIGMLVVFALLSVGQIFDTFVTAVLSEYMGLLIRVGFAGFLLANVDAIDPAAIELFGSSADRPAAEPTGSGAD